MSGRTCKFVVSDVGSTHIRDDQSRWALVVAHCANERIEFRHPESECPRVGEHIHVSMAWGFDS